MSPEESFLLILFLARLQVRILGNPYLRKSLPFLAFTI
jgi:hypothetical protein